MLKHDRVRTYVTIALILVIVALSWSYRPWRQSSVTSTRTEYTGTFGGHCDPHDNLVCIGNADKSVTVGDQSFQNGLKPHQSLPNKGAKVTVKVKEVKHGDLTTAVVVSIMSEGK